VVGETTVEFVKVVPLGNNVYVHVELSVGEVTAEIVVLLPAQIEVLLTLKLIDGVNEFIFKVKLFAELYPVTKI
jgi:hypothetical protein